MIFFYNSRLRAAERERGMACSKLHPDEDEFSSRYRYAVILSGSDFFDFSFRKWDHVTAHRFSVEGGTELAVQ